MKIPLEYPFSVWVVETLSFEFVLAISISDFGWICESLPTWGYFKGKVQHLTLGQELLMQLSSRFVGTTLRPYRTEITWRETMNYAAALEDPNPLYFDDEREGGIIAPPCSALP